MTEYEPRRSRLLTLAEAQGLDALALMPGPNLVYLTGMHYHLSERPVLLILSVDDDPAVILPELEAGKAEAEEFTTFAYSDTEGYLMAFHEACVSLELAEARVGVEALRMRFLESSTLRRFAPEIDLIPMDDLVAQLRVIKSDRELDAMRRAIAVAEDAFVRWVDVLDAGMTEKAAASLLTAELLRGGADALAFNPIVASGPNGGLPHAVPGARQFEQGDWVVVDWGGNVGGYASDLTRMVVIGEPTGPLRRIYDVVLRANRIGCEAVQPGVEAQQVDAATRAVIADAGYGPQFVHRTGHGLGLETHESPYLVAGNSSVLEPGMTFTVEPGIYVKGLGGVRIEDDVRMTAQGGVVMTSLSREPFVVR
jgi:Xaa-Pro dipeptidase